ncbi:hypothetical protein B0H63DRAFT_89459 [Podospora didyma]|uniref:Actin-like ATPase domain-containing protein n=1 Tax=Podospora didyma TaxID=330526 RepID=A0AAE0N141_9PEZI|nr:hypothetical protein B0H63DRAFT_89459 [Podospora didyma]
MSRRHVKPPIRTAVLGLHFGSTSLRAGLTAHRDPEGRFYHVRNHRPDLIRPWIVGDFSTACAPFEADYLGCIGNDAQARPRNVSAKYLMYLLTDFEDVVMAKHPLLPQELCKRRGDEAFVVICRAILVQLLKNLKQKIDAVCKSECLEYTEMVVTVSWEKHFQVEYFSIIIEEAFGWTGKMDRVHVVAEADALANYVMTIQEEKLCGWDRILFLDFGGHCMSFTLYKSEQLDDQVCLIELRCGGVIGGNEIWFHHIAELISKKLQEMEIDDPEEQLRRKLTTEFVSLQSRNEVKNDTTTFVYTPSLDDPGKILTVGLQPYEIDRCFNQAFEGPVILAKEQLKYLATFDKSSSIGVVVAGGSMTEGSGAVVFPDCPVSEDKFIFNSSLEPEYLSTHKCRGAVIAVTSSKIKISRTWE